VELVDRLEDKMKLIDLAITLAYDAKANYADVSSQVRMWDTIIYNYLKKQNIVIPPKEKSEKDKKYEGAYVKEPTPGSYDWVVSFDLNSLYPHLIMQYAISPETLVDMDNLNSRIMDLEDALQSY
jgi:DNA polymerase elongation subunit (family B)